MEQVIKQQVIKFKDDEGVAVKSIYNGGGGSFNNECTRYIYDLANDLNLDVGNYAVNLLTDTNRMHMVNFSVIGGNQWKFCSGDGRSFTPEEFHYYFKMIEFSDFQVLFIKGGVERDAVLNFDKLDLNSIFGIEFLAEQFDKLGIELAVTHSTFCFKLVRSERVVVFHAHVES